MDGIKRTLTGVGLHDVIIEDPRVKMVILYVLRSLPDPQGNIEYFHFYLAIVPRLTKAAGFDLGSGMYINTQLPEKDAEFLRGVRIPDK